MSLSTMNGDGSLVRCLVERLTTRVRRPWRGAAEQGIGSCSASACEGWGRERGENTLVLTSCSPQCSFHTELAPPAKTSLKMTSFSSLVPPC